MPSGPGFAGWAFTMLARPKFIRRPLAYYHPVMGHVAVAARCLERHLHWRLGSKQYCASIGRVDLPHRIKKHQSVLVRRMPGADLQLQLNKVHNLKLVIDLIDGILIEPGETFSFWRCVGRPTRVRGFKPGVELARGRARAGVGGGICQSSNLLYWLAIHSELEIVERHHHSFDPFPDDGRVLPYASGATVKYNYRDLQISNRTDATFQIRLWLDKKCLNGDLRSDRKKRRSYKVLERNHRFFMKKGGWYRTNQLWRRVADVENDGVVLGEEHLVTNCGRVMYEPAPIDCSLTRLS